MVHDKIALPSASFAPRDAQEIAAEIEARAYRVSVLADHASSQLTALKRSLQSHLPSAYRDVSDWDLLSVLLDVMNTQADEVRELSERIELWGAIKVVP